MVDTWKYLMKNITKTPSLYKVFKTKYILLDNGSFPCNTRAGALRYIKSTLEYKKRVNKPLIEIKILKDRR